MFKWIFGEQDGEQEITQHPLSPATDVSCDSGDSETDPKDGIAEDWVAVLEEGSQSVRTIDIDDLYRQKARNKLGRWDPAEDMLIENPLVNPINNTVSRTYAKVAAPSYAEVIKLALNSESSRGFNIAETDGYESIWVPVTRKMDLNNCTALAQIEVEAKYGLSTCDSFDWCPSSRAARRMNSRTYSLKSCQGARQKKITKPRNRNSNSRPL